MDIYGRRRRAVLVDARNHQRGFLNHLAIEADGETSCRGIHGDHHRHVGTADRLRPQNAEEQRHSEEVPQYRDHRDQGCRPRSAPQTSCSRQIKE